MAFTEEGWHTVADGTKLYTKTWKPADQPKAILVFVHGFSDHCNAYYGFFPGLANHGIEVRAFDQRGWGRSVTDAASKGDTGPSTVVLDDINSFITSVHQSLENKATPPIFLMGHSMGGGEVLYDIFDSAFPTYVRGVLAHAPLVALHPSTRPLKLTVLLGRLAAKLKPNLPLYKPLDPTLICRDKQVCEEWKNDALCHDTGTFGGLAGLLDRSAWLDDLQHRPKEERKPHSQPALWICHGTADQINDFEATKLFAEAVDVPDKTFKVYEGGYHKLHCEPDGIKEALLKDVAEWILARSDRSPARENGTAPVKTKL